MKPLIAVLCGTTHTTGARPQPRDFANRAYSAAVRRAGGVPLLLPLGGDDEDVRAVLAAARGLLVTGGADIAPGVYGEEREPECREPDPLRDDVDRRALAEALGRHMPVLGICRGIQALAAFRGGSLHQHVPGHQQDAPRGQATHEVVVEPDTLLARLVGAGVLPVNTFHHQTVKGVPPGFRVAARTAEGVIEGIEADDGSFCLGVQWHPEDLAAASPPHQALFDALLAAAGR